MKLSKFILFISLFTFFAIVYVYQQSEIFRLAYLGQKKATEFQDLLDKNTILRYNIESSASLIRISNTISGAWDYEMPATYQLVKFSQPLENAKSKAKASKRVSLIARFFSIKRQAEARTINP